MNGCPEHIKWPKTSLCKGCRNLYMRGYRLKNNKKMKEYYKSYYYKNKDKRYESFKKYYIKNKDRIVQCKKEWWKNRNKP